LLSINIETTFCDYYLFRRNQHITLGSLLYNISIAWA
jgi:hypothetical protein